MKLAFEFLRARQLKQSSSTFAELQVAVLPCVGGRRGRIGPTQTDNTSAAGPDRRAAAFTPASLRIFHTPAGDEPISPTATPVNAGDDGACAR